MLQIQFSESTESCIYNPGTQAIASEFSHPTLHSCLLTLNHLSRLTLFLIPASHLFLHVGSNVLWQGPPYKLSLFYFSAGIEPRSMCVLTLNLSSSAEPMPFHYLYVLSLSGCSSTKLFSHLAVWNFQLEHQNKSSPKAKVQKSQSGLD